MTVSIQNISGIGSSWSEYTLGVSGDREKATLILGDTAIGDALVDSINYKSGNYIRFVVSFAEEDNVTVEQGRAITKEFFDNFMHGFSKEEYHLDLVEHKNTKQLHYHGRIPKINLVTQTQLKAYWHKSDLNFLKATIADIAYRHNLIIGMDKKKLLKDPLEVKNRIAKWREEHNEKALDFTNRKGKEMAELQLTDHISDAVSSGLISDLDSVKTELAALGLEVVKDGYDIPRGFHYVTVMKDDIKIRLKGDIYARQFYKLDGATRKEKISSNSALERRTESDRTDGNKIGINLHREREKRSKWIAKQYKAGRKRASDKAIKASQHEQIKLDKNTQTATDLPNPWSVRPGVDYRYLGNSIHNKIKEQHDSIGTEISRCIRVRADKQRSRADSISRATKRIKQNSTKRIQPTRGDYKIITERRRGRKLVRAVSKNIGTVVSKLAVEFKRRFNSLLEELKLQTKRKKVVYENTIEEIEKEEKLISPSSDMIEGYNHINSKSEEVTIKTSII